MHECTHRERAPHQEGTSSADREKQLVQDLEAILAAKHPILRYFHNEIKPCSDDEHIKEVVRRLNLLSSYLKKRCVLFLKGGRLRSASVPTNSR